MAFCRPFVDRIIADTAPVKILTLGMVAAREIVSAVLPRDHGKHFGRVVPIYKPDFIVANPAVKKDVWEVLKALV
jgi:uracil-DNA glycosylase